MGRIRTVKPELFQHEGLFAAEQETGLPLRLAFIGLFTQCDKEGRFEWRPNRLKLNILPWDSVDYARVLDALATRGFLVKYACDGREYGYVPSWRRHQAVNNREKESELPEPNENNSLPTREGRVDDACSTRHGNLQGEGKGREGKGREREDARVTRATPKTGPPKEFQITEELRRYARDKGLPNGSWLTEETQRFLDHHRAKGSMFSDWPAAWRNWMRNAVKFGQVPGIALGSDEEVTRVSSDD